MTSKREEVRFCDGSCDEHSGPIREVRVFKRSGGFYTLLYCDEAIAEDHRRGFKVVDQEARRDAIRECAAALNNGLNDSAKAIEVLRASFPDAFEEAPAQ
jgi:hypothetical protein